MVVKTVKHSKEEMELYAAFLKLETTEECYRFFRDLCTPAEIDAMKERWRIVTLLKAGHSYRKIHELSGSSIATIGRVARFLSQEDYGGYRLLLDRMKEGEKMTDE